jgi:hypothetical protein
MIITMCVDYLPKLIHFDERNSAIMTDRLEVYLYSKRQVKETAVASMTAQCFTEGDIILTKEQFV